MSVFVMVTDSMTISVDYWFGCNMDDNILVILLYIIIFMIARVGDLARK